jgi:hypothetical protein
MRLRDKVNSLFSSLRSICSLVPNFKKKFILLENRISNLEMRVSPLTFLETSKIFSIVSILQPLKIMEEQIRIGNHSDGGYVLIKPPQNVLVLSLGVGNEISADLDLIKNFDARIYAFDPFVSRPKIAPVDNYEFFDIGFSPTESQIGNLNFRNLEGILSKLPRLPDLALIDIEGNEWGLFNELSLLTKVPQIIIEFHDLERIHDQDFIDSSIKFFQRICESHVVAHVHGNNDGPTLALGGATWPGILEVSFISRNSLRSGSLEPNYGPWPTPLDFPNSRSRPDILLEPFFGVTAPYRKS